MKIQKLATVAIVICMLFSMTACSSNEMSDETADIRPHEMQTYKLPNSDNRGGFESTLYSYTKNGSALVKTAQHIYLYDANTTPLKALLSSLFANADSFPNISFKDIILSDDICSVFLSGDLPSDIEDWFGLEAMVSATLKDFCGVSKVLLFLNNTPAHYNGIPFGIVSYGGQTLYDYIAERKEAINLNNEQETAFTVPSIQYFPVFSNPYEFVCAKQANLKISKQDSIEKLVNDTVSSFIGDISKAYSRQFDVITGKFCDCKIVSISRESEKYTVSLTLENVIKANFEQPIKYSIALTLLSSIPNVTKVCVTINPFSEETLNFKNCRYYIGTRISAFYPIAKSMTLETKEIYVSSDKMYDCSAVLLKMQEYYSVKDTLFPNNFVGGSISIKETEGIAVIDFSKDTIKTAMDFMNNADYFDSPETGERLLIYSIVNTLTQFPHINSVLFLTEGNLIEAPFHSIYLGKPLASNPGLLQSNG